MPGGPACLSGALSVFWEGHSAERQLDFLCHVHRPGAPGADRPPGMRVLSRVAEGQADQLAAAPDGRRDAGRDARSARRSRLWPSSRTSCAATTRRSGSSRSRSRSRSLTEFRAQRSPEVEPRLYFPHGKVSRNGSTERSRGRTLAARGRGRQDLRARGRDGGLEADGAQVEIDGAVDEDAMGDRDDRPDPEGQGRQAPVGRASRSCRATATASPRTARPRAAPARRRRASCPACAPPPPRVDDAAVRAAAAIVDAHDDRRTAVGARDADAGAERQRLVRGGHALRVVALARGGAPPSNLARSSWPRPPGPRRGRARAGARSPRSRSRGDADAGQRGDGEHDAGPARRAAPASLSAHDRAPCRRPRPEDRRRASPSRLGARPPCRRGSR